MNQKALALKKFKDQFFKHQSLVHLNNAGLAPISKAAKDTIQYWGQRFFEEGFQTDHDYMMAVQNTRASLAKLIGCDSSEVAFFVSTSGGINQVAMQLSLQPDDEVLMWDQEYSSHLYPWQYACLKSGARLKLVSSDRETLETPTDQFLDSITEKTKVVAFSWMQFQAGHQMNYEQVISACKKKGIFVFVDCMQGLGILPCDLWSLGVDAVAGGSHKWLVSPVGAGYLALRNSFVTTLKPLQYGSSTFGTCDDPSDLVCAPKLDASKFEPGSKQVLEIAALGSSVDLILDVGVEVLLEEAMRLKNSFIRELDRLEIPFLNRNGKSNPILNFAPKSLEKKARLIQNLKDRQILFAQRGPGVRIGFHAFNSENDLDRLIDAVQKS